MKRKMRDSGIAWIGEVPEGWNVVPLKHTVACNSDALPENTSPSFEFDYVDIGSVEYGKGITSTEHFTFSSAPSRARRVAVTGDIIISTVRTYLKAIAIVPSNSENLIFSTGFAVLHVNDGECSQFLSYELQSHGFVSEVEKFSTGVGYPGISATSLTRLKVVMPPLPEQRAIAAYLDAECGKIDALRGKLEAQIADLQSYKKSVITEAVTKGLKPNRKLKPSGVEWIGDVPEEWKVEPSKFVIFVKSNLVPPDKYLDLPQISPECIEKDSGKLVKEWSVQESGVSSGNHLFYKGQIIYSKIRPTLNKVIIAPYDGLCSADMYPIETNEDTSYVRYLMLSSGFVSQVALVTQDRIKMPKINQEELGRIVIAVPPLSEQREIAAYLDEKCGKIDAAVAKCREQLDDLASYKKSLIYECVTGKKQVA